MKLPFKSIAVSSVIDGEHVGCHYAGKVGVFLDRY